MEDNSILLSGIIEENITFSHTSKGATFLMVHIASKRKSGIIDHIHCMIQENLYGKNKDWIVKGVHVSLNGCIKIFRTMPGFQDYTGQKLHIYVYIDEIWETENHNDDDPSTDTISKQAENNDGIYPDDNMVTMTGVIRDNPIFRTTPSGKEITNLIITVPRSRVNDHFPCICWWKTAQEAAQFQPGDKVKLTGRLQSRTYSKIIDGEKIDFETHEISVLHIGLCDNNMD